MIKVGNKGPYGMELVGDRNNCGLIISSWARLADGKFGPIQRHGESLNTMQFNAKYLQRLPLPYSLLSHHSILTSSTLLYPTLLYS